MSEKKFNAILAKNYIAREIAYAICRGEKTEISRFGIIQALKQIEDYLGRDNQPSISEIIKVNSKAENYI